MKRRCQPISGHRQGIRQGGPLFRYPHFLLYISGFCDRHFLLFCRYYTKRELSQTPRTNAASRASSIESFRSSSIQQIDRQTPESLEFTEHEDRKVAKKLSVIPAEDEEPDTITISEDPIKFSNGSPKSNLTCGGLGFSNNFAFDELSPIREMMEASVGNMFMPEEISHLYQDEGELMDEFANTEEECSSTKRRSTERQRAISSGDEDERRGLTARKRGYNSSRNNLKHIETTESPCLSRTPSEPTTINQISKVVRRVKAPMLRR